MLGQPMSMVLPEVIGYKLTGTLSPQSTSTDLVLTITQVFLLLITIYILVAKNYCRTSVLRV